MHLYKVRIDPDKEKAARIGQFSTMTRDNTSATTAATLRATVRGHVQGVFFRAFVRDGAERLGLGGYVRNQPDGTVFVVAHGPRPKLEELLALLRRGPESARVSGVDHEWVQSD